MATDVFINIKDLPEVTEAKNGDYLIVETSAGTNLIDFKNFIIPTENTVITTTVTQNTNAILALSSTIDLNYSDLSASISEKSNNISVLSSIILNDPSYNLTVAKTQITIPVNNTEGSNVLSKAGNWTLKDLIISPANEYAATFPAYPVNIDATGLVTIRGTFNIQRVISIAPTPLNMTSTIDATSSFNNLTVGAYTNSVSVNQLNVANFINNLVLSSEYIPAQELAVYNVYAIGYSS